MILSAFLLPHPPVILPEVGKGREQEIQTTIDAFNECARQISQLKPDTIILVSPHCTCYTDYFHISPGKFAVGDLGRFGASKVRITADYDIKLATEIEKTAATTFGIPAGTHGEQSPQLDHGTIVPLCFVNKYYTGYELVRIGVSGLSLETHYEFGKAIATSAKWLGKRIVFIASGDLSHVLPQESGVKLDAEITDALANGELSRLLQIPPELIENGAECGLRPLVVMFGALDGLDVSAKLLSYEGTFGVGYAVASFVPNEGDMK